MIFKRLLNKVIEFIGSKEGAESLFWKNHIENMEKWYTGELSCYYKTSSPKESEKIKVRNLKDSSILTWFKLHQQEKYLKDLKLTDQAFSEMKLLDVGAGPIPSSMVFRNCEIYCLEPLLHKYLEAGYPLHYYDHCRYIHAHSEEIPVEDNFFDAVISVNAIDHVDDLSLTSIEIKRVLKENGLLRMHVHYHRATKWEPIVITDELFMELFSWCQNLHKIDETKSSYSMSAGADESFALWSNFDSS
jgi:SAM-dependent methyltransferase